jgi:hypothetical protein
MRLEMEETQAKYLESLQQHQNMENNFSCQMAKLSSSSHGQSSSSSSQTFHQMSFSSNGVNPSCFMHSLAQHVQQQSMARSPPSQHEGNNEVIGGNEVGQGQGTVAAAAAAAMAFNTLAFKAMMHHQHQQQQSHGIDWAQFQFPGVAGPASNSQTINNQQVNNGCSGPCDDRGTNSVQFAVGTRYSDQIFRGLKKQVL